MRKCRIIIVMLVVAATVFLNGCATMPPVKLPGQNITINYEKPEIELVPTSKQTQGSEKTSITVTTLRLKESELKYRTEYEQLQINSSECCMMMFSAFLLGSAMRTYKKTVTPYYKIPQQDLVFGIFIENHLGHILYLDRSVVTLEVNDELVYWNQVRYLLLSQLFEDIILPEEQCQPIKIRIPIDTLHSPSKIVLSIYDIVTGMDAAGNPTERLSYKWEFQYTVEKTAKQEQITVEQIQLKTEEALKVGALP